MQSKLLACIGKCNCGLLDKAKVTENHLKTVLIMGYNQNPYYFLNTYCLRTPMYPLSFYKELVGKTGHSRTLLKRYWEDTLIKEAIFLASHYLHTQLEQYFNEDSLKDNAGLEETFFKYLTRISTRCTPFGLFSGVSTATIGQSSSSEIRQMRKTAFDNHFLQSLSEKLSQVEVLKNQLSFYTNTSLYKAAGYIRYIDYQLKDNRRAYSLEAVAVTDHLESTLSLAKKGKTIDQLSENLVNETISLADARSFIELLIDNKLLVSQLELSVTGDDVLSEYTELLKSYKSTEGMVQQLEELAESLSTLDQKFGNDHIAYESLIKKIESLNVPFERKYLFQTDLSLNRKLGLINEHQAYALRRVIPLLMKLNPFDELDNLKEFKKAFLRRWEGQEVPLATALDIESGIGYVQDARISNTTPFLQDITPSAKPSRSISYTLNESSQIIFEKLKKAVEQSAYCIELADKDFEEIDLEWDNLPDTLACQVQVFAHKQNALYLSYFGGGAAKLLARFCHCDEGINTLTSQIASIEKRINSDKVLAEIAHLPESRVGNILKRPHLRDYEIPYIAHSKLPMDRQISLDDLMVSVKNDRIVLKSKKLGKEVLPKLTNAHNYSAKGLPVYYFLCDLENQNKNPYLGFSWPDIALNFSFLPRVSYKNIILSKARWIIEGTELEQLGEWKYHDDLLSQIEGWRKKHKMPRYVEIGRGDNRLPVDLHKTKSVKFLINSIKNKSQLLIEESLVFGNTDAGTDSESYANELIIPFYNKSKLTL